MKVHIDISYDWLQILPMAVLTADKNGGIFLSVGWIFFSIHFM